MRLSNFFVEVWVFLKWVGLEVNLRRILLRGVPDEAV